MQEKKKGRIIPTKTITKNKFLKLLNNGILRKTLEDEGLNAIYFKHSFEDTDNSYLEEIKKSKIVGGLSGEAKQLVDKFSRVAKEKGQPFTDFESEGLLYVTVYDDNNLVYCIPVFSFRDNKKVDLKKIEYISEDAKRMEYILRGANEKKKEIEKDY
ncbi:hypothetical protein [Fusobacterium nucleatum]|jgi:hypothetical protein|uniref:hypothetical protein n=1 Tax=Fusobacterium nucleatum TaxID=851 RepID=UPI0030CC66ED